MYTYTTMWVQRIEFLFSLISPSSQCYARQSTWVRLCVAIGSGTLQNQIRACSAPPPIHTYLITVSVLPPPPIKRYSWKASFLIPLQWSWDPSLRLVCIWINYLLCLRDTGSPVQGSHDQWVLIHFNHFLWKELLSWREGSVVRNIKDILWVAKGEKK